MDLISLLATVILITTIGTLVVAVAAYIAFKLRDKRKPRRRDPTVSSEGPHTPIFLKRYVPTKAATQAHSQAHSQAHAQAQPQAHSQAQPQAHSQAQPSTKQ